MTENEDRRMRAATLVDELDDYRHTPGPRIALVENALAAERRATVDQIKTTVLLRRNRLGKPFKDIYVPELLAILEEVVGP